MKNKILSLLLVFAMCFGLLTACGDANTGNSEPGTQTESQTESESQKETASETESETQKENNTEAGTEAGSETETQGGTSIPDNGETTTPPDNGETNNPGSVDSNTGATGAISDKLTISVSDIPAYSGTGYIALNNNKPFFFTANAGTTGYATYSELDALGRVGAAYGCLGPDTLPSGDRGSLSVKPTGWQQYSYPNTIVKQSQIWNRSHLIAWSLAGENNNKLNLMTGTPQFNQINMQIFETLVLDYIKETGKHVLYRVTPVFDGNNLVANGAVMEGWSVEDNGESICYCVYIYNVQDNVVIDYATGYNQAADGSCGINANGEFDNNKQEADKPPVDPNAKYAVNGNNGKIHIVGACSATEAGNKGEMKNPIYFDTLEEAEQYQKENFPEQSKPKCGNCFK